MTLKRAVWAAGLVVVLAGTAAAQDVVRLRNGATLTGSVSLDGDGKSGFTLKRWDTGGSIFVLWSQLPDSEAYRIRNAAMGSAAGAEAVGVLIDAVKIVTSSREIIGVVTAEDAQNVSVKTKEGIQQAPKAGILQRTAIKVRESDVYTIEEMVARKAKDVPATDYARLLEVGNYASSLRAYSLAKEYYQKADACADASKKGEVGILLAGIDMKIKEEAGEKALVQVWKLAGELKFAEALEAANKFFSEFGETETAKANAQLIATLEAKQKEFQANRDKVFGDAVPKQWRDTRATLLTEYAKKKEIKEARELIAKVDEEIANRVAKNLNCERQEAEKHWLARTEKKLKKVGLKSGTWILNSGQDGGMDFVGDPKAGKDDPVEEFKKKFGNKDGRGGGGGGQEGPKQYGLPLDDQQGWWEKTSAGDRKEWLEAAYSIDSTMANKDPDAREEKDCSICKGNGKMKGVRHGVSLEYICHECHGCKKVVAIKYW